MWWFFAYALASELDDFQNELLEATKEYTQASPPPVKVIRPFRSRLKKLEAKNGRTHQSAVLAAMVHMGMRDRGAAQEAFEWALSEDPSNTHTWWMAAQELERDDPEAGVALFRRAVEAVPADGELKMGLADRLPDSERRMQLYVACAQSTATRSRATCLERAIQTAHALGHHDKVPALLTDLEGVLQRPEFVRERNLVPGRRFVVRQRLAGDPTWILQFENPEHPPVALFENGIIGGEPVPGAEGHWVFLRGDQALQGPPMGTSYEDVMAWTFEVVGHPRR